ncbi:MAG TPA: hypothetical protein VNW53_07275 [Phenylobacterium sp.]|jgi:hypothetical protein|uniref:hypothetical protein n=1 Tax=Phenylobacterium sp. TaxID=1871053 RepID=UPI002C9FA8E7|nr:hypothetical protein [Phenylobacterium sp.]HXA38781.1 hypothetical protein [Phenylobacterium sp.]
MAIFIPRSSFPTADVVRGGLNPFGASSRPREALSAAWRLDADGRPSRIWRRGSPRPPG